MASPAVAPAKPKATDFKVYAYSGAFDHAKFKAGYTARFGKVAAVDTALADLDTLLGFMEADATITDIRWVAYMLATVMWETKSLVAVTRILHDKKGKVLLDKAGKPATRIGKDWKVTMAPVSEIGHGSGRRYHEPVKIEIDTAAAVTVIEHDGDQFSISATGNIKPVGKKTNYGAPDGGAIGKAYAKSTGVERSFYGRGYVQLTWWYNYVAAGKAIGKGSDLLLDPERVETPAIAYQIMSVGMVNGTIFANGRKFSTYFTADKTDYAGARAMVNSRDPQQGIVDYAKDFEAILLDAKLAK